ncbi:glycosyltransferase family 2 protein [Brevundimonas diminuta]|uniref:glycosyltransferase family 2 protein n=1 Tax=Brevundimonas diminuta TaxID=293 RepID=UPI001F582E35|nr:glycosyltransferase family 2 protein [Brevundimonas diminuta]
MLLAALAAQDLPGRISVALCINNSTDGSLPQAQAAADRWKDRLDIVVDLQTFPDHRAHAGAARRAAMSIGLEHLGDRSNGVLISTDADTRPPPNWLSANLAAIASGADLVGGRLVLDEAESISSDVAVLRRLWDAYWHEVRAIEDEIDPSPHDPAPRHGDHTGASLAITAVAYLSAGGVPEQPAGEDLALVIAAQAQGARLVHPLAVWTRVSARTTGRAVGGMAEDMIRLFDQARNGGPIMAPDFSHWRQRASWRRDQRHDAASARRLPALETRLPAMPLDMDLRSWADGIARAAA